MKSIYIAILGTLVLSMFAGGVAFAQNATSTATSTPDVTEIEPETSAPEVVASPEVADEAVIDQLAQQIEALVQEIARLQAEITAFLNSQPQAQTGSQFQTESQVGAQAQPQEGAGVQGNASAQGQAAAGAAVQPNLAGVRFERELSEGMEGDDVWLLQEILATDPAIYPEGLTTGYYGELTGAAVVRFQQRFGIEPATGNVDQATMTTLNNLVDAHIGDSGQVPQDILSVQDIGEEGTEEEEDAIDEEADATSTPGT